MVLHSKRFQIASIALVFVVGATVSAAAMHKRSNKADVLSASTTKVELSQASELPQAVATTSSQNPPAPQPIKPQNDVHVTAPESCQKTVTQHNSDDPVEDQDADDDSDSDTDNSQTSSSSVTVRCESSSNSANSSSSSSTDVSVHSQQSVSSSGSANASNHSSITINQ